jgi:ATP-dependent Lon protease
MTGEVTLRGRVLPVGGIKMKILAAHRAGLDTVILPKRNERDLDELPDEIRGSMTFQLIENIDEALKWALASDDEELRGPEVIGNVTEQAPLKSGISLN